MTPLCQCGKPAPSAIICGDCERALTMALLTAVVLGADLDLAIARQVRFADHGGTRSRSQPLPFDERASAAAGALRNTLAGWVRVLAESAWPEDTIAAMALWLAAHIAAIRQHEAAGEAVREITAAVRRAQRAVDRPPGRVYGGPCPSCHADLLGEPGALTVICHGCGNAYDLAGRQAWLRAQLEDLLGTAPWCATVATALGLNVSAGTVRMWASRHRLEVRHMAARPGGLPQPLYRAGDVIELALHRDTARRVR